MGLRHCRRDRDQVNRALTQKWIERMIAVARIGAMRKTCALAVAVVALAWSAAVPGMAAEATLVCMNSGKQYQVGDYACLPACHGRQRYARCDLVAKVASWTYISDVCPMALLAPAEPKAVSLAPVATAMTPLPLNIPMSAIAPDIQERIAEVDRAPTAVASR
jgi:hypothetical protein